MLNQLFIKVGVIAYWKINQEYIVQTWCINKDKPRMKCNGKCHLSKQLAKVEAQESSDQNTTNVSFFLKKILETDVFLPCEKFIFDFYIHISSIKASLIPFANDFYAFNLVSHTFQPPERLI